MVQVAARGAANLFSDADLLDRRWWSKLWWILGQTEEDNYVLFRKLQHNQHVSVLDYRLPDKVFDTHWDQAGEALNDIWNSLFPWRKRDKNSVNPEYEKLRNAWIRYYGDPNDPETQNKIEQTVQHVSRMIKENKDKQQPKRKRRDSIIRWR